MTKGSSRFRLRFAAAIVLMIGLLAAELCSAQVAPPQDRSRAIDISQSRAENAADEMVSLSPDKIIQLLREEAGLALQIKKLLVRKAFEQGRLLNPDDLTDDALFRLVRDDETTRVLITHEIVDRNYIRVKPTQKEMEGGLAVPFRNPKDGTALAGAIPPNPSQEEVYWATHQGIEEIVPEQAMAREQAEQDLEKTRASANQPPLTPSFQFPEAYPAEPGARPTPSPAINDPRRQLQMADLPDGDYPDLVGGTGLLPQITPEQLPQLLAASQQSAEGNGGTGLSRGAGGLGSALSPSMGSLDSMFAMGTSLSSSSLFSTQSQTPYPQEARREIPPAWQIPMRSPAQPPLRHHPNPYADVPSLYDLYSQYPGQPARLARFGADIFRVGTSNFNQLPMDIPAGPEYVLGPGDGVTVILWGGVSERLVRTVDREGRVALPEVGTLEVAGKSLGEVQREVQAVLRTQYRDVQADIALSRLRSVRVYVVGDVQRPGPYDISALSTPLNAVYTAGGPTANGSLRTIRHYRGKQLIQETDVYDLLLHGVRSDLQSLQAGDTLLVPPLGPVVTVEGMVRRPAIYELSGEKNLTDILALAGGVLQSGTLRHVDVERVESHLSRTMLRLDIPEDNNQAVVAKALDDFAIQDGDKVKISPILPYADKAVYLTGHVFRPGKFAYRDGMTLTDIIHSYSELQPEPYKQHAEIIRLNQPDYQPTVLAFNLDDALSGKLLNLALKPFDTIRIFGRYDFEDTPLITVTGEVRDPGDHITNGATYLRDAVYLAGGTTPDAQLGAAQVFRKTDDGKLEVLSVNLSKALAGDAADNILLAPKDRVFIHKNLDRADPPAVEIQGEVARPGKYPLGENLTAAGLVRLAGGLKRSAFLEQADLMRYPVEMGSRVVGEHSSVPLAKAMAEEPDSDVRLHNGDVLTVRQLAGWNDIGATIEVKGEVVHPGTFGIKDGERLSSILARAGGLRESAYPYGAVFERKQVRDLEEKDRGQMIEEIRNQGAQLKLAPDTDPDQKLAKEAALEQWQETLQKLQNLPPEGRLVIHISANLKRWENTPGDIQVRAGDSIFIPKRPNTVMVDGSVYSPTAITYRSGHNAGWYLRQAGGPNNLANRSAIFVIRADGSVAGSSSGLFSGRVSSADLRPGDMVVVPQKAFSANSRWKSILEGSQVAYAVGIAIQVARSF